MTKRGAKGDGRAFANSDDVLLALEAGEVDTLTSIRLRYTGRVIDLTTAYDDQDVLHTEPITVKHQFVKTTVGRVIFNDHLPKGMPDVTVCSARRSGRTGELLLSPLRARHYRPHARRGEDRWVPMSPPRPASRLELMTWWCRGQQS